MHSGTFLKQKMSYEISQLIYYQVLGTGVEPVQLLRPQDFKS